MSRTTLADALAKAGIALAVEELGKLAVLGAGGTNQQADLATATARRREIVALARAHGFTNVCIELSETNAVVSGA
jgi:hypothetical protein